MIDVIFLITFCVNFWQYLFLFSCQRIKNGIAW